MSYWTNAAVAAKNAVAIPNNAVRAETLGKFTNKLELRIINTIPAVTIVAAWIKADTGVGPSIASGNQVCLPNCALLPTAASNKHNPIHSKLDEVYSFDVKAKSIIGNTIPKSNVRAIEKIKAKPVSRKTSPIRLTTIALIAALLANERVNQKLINAKLIIPTPSHPTNNTKKLLAVTRINMKNANIDRYVKKRTT